MKVKITDHLDERCLTVNIECYEPTILVFNLSDLPDRRLWPEAVWRQPLHFRPCLSRSVGSS